MNKYEILKTYFGYDSFRGAQEILIDSILSGKDVLGIMPTGAGKSLCYQILALMLELDRTLMLVGLMIKKTRSPMRVAMQ